jgi:hypothetical protein
VERRQARGASAGLRGGEAERRRSHGSHCSRHGEGGGEALAAEWQQSLAALEQEQGAAEEPQSWGVTWLGALVRTADGMEGSGRTCCDKEAGFLIFPHHELQSHFGLSSQTPAARDGGSYLCASPAM